jgi:hypothetical protein
MTADKDNKKRIIRRRKAVIRSEGDPKPVRVQSGLWSRPDKWGLDRRLALAKHLDRVRARLAALFPKAPDGAALLLIDRITYKSLKLAMFEALDLAAAPETATAATALTPQQKIQKSQVRGHGFPMGNFQRYIQMSNSLREDLRLLHQLANRQAPEPSDPDLAEYLATLRKAAKATPVNVERS